MGLFLFYVEMFLKSSFSFVMIIPLAKI